MTCSAHGVDGFHERLARRAQRHVSLPLRIEQHPPGGNWRNAGRDRPVAFCAIAEDWLEFAERARGVRWPVCPLHPTASTEPRAWLGWRDSWHSKGNRAFAFDGACWTLFWGRPYVGEKAQLLRAEWDGSTENATRFAQPHWHFDREHVAPIQAPAGVAPRTGSALVELEELPTHPTNAGTADEVMQQLDLSGIHLGMAGWNNDTRHPACWQPSLGVDELLDWATRTLELIVHELPRMPKSPVE